jgi:putative endonuclease
MITENRKTGNLGEDIACRYLVKKGFTIMERNYLRKWGEIDIVAKKNELIHFIEVKSVSCEISVSLSPETDTYRPEENVHPEKLKRLSRVIQTYLLEKNISHETWQFDVITVYIDRKSLISRVILLENIIL